MTLWRCRLPPPLRIWDWVGHLTRRRVNRAHNLSVLLGPASMVKEEEERRKECLEYLGIYGYISQLVALWKAESETRIIAAENIAYTSNDKKI